MIGCRQLVALLFVFITSGLTLESKPTPPPNFSRNPFDLICDAFDDQSTQNATVFYSNGFRLASWQGSVKGRSHVFKEVVKNKQANFYVWLSCEKASIKVKLFWQTTTSTLLRDSGDFLEIIAQQARGRGKWGETVLTLLAPDMKFVCLDSETLIVSFIVYGNSCIIQTFNLDVERTQVKRSLALIFVKDFIYSERHELLNEIKYQLFLIDPGVEFKFNELSEADLKHDVPLMHLDENNCLKYVRNKPEIGWISSAIGIATAIFIVGVCVWYGFCRDANVPSIQ